MITPSGGLCAKGLPKRGLSGSLCAKGLTDRGEGGATLVISPTGAIGIMITLSGGLCAKGLPERGLSGSLCAKKLTDRGGRRRRASHVSRRSNSYNDYVF